MTSIWFVGSHAPTETNPDQARDTVQPLVVDERAQGDAGAPVPELKDAPEFNQVDTDTNPNLTGLAPRTVAGEWHESQQYRPESWNFHDPQGDYTSRINDQVASSGTAAMRESAGQQGHGTMPYAESLEPQIRDGAELGGLYFSSEPLLIQEGMGDYLRPTVGDPEWNAVAQALGTTGSRDAYRDTLYKNFWSNS